MVSTGLDELEVRNADDIVKEPENFSVPWKSAYITRVPPLSASVCDDIDFAESHVIPTEL